MIALATIALHSCAIEDPVLPDGKDEVCITLRPSLDGTIATRAIGDASKIDELVIGVYGNNNRIIPLQRASWDEAEANGISLTLIEGRTYDIVLWAQKSSNTAYELTDDGKITVDYGDYKNGGFAKMEELDAFYAKTSLTVGNQKVEDKGKITLTRPLAQFNFADSSTQPVQGTHTAKVKFESIPVSFNPFTGAVEMSEEEVEFTFTDFPAEVLSVEGVPYYYISCNYLFVPADGSTLSLNATLDLQKDGTSIKTVDLTGAALESNKKTNVLGSMVQEPETWSVWDGNIPTQSTITTDAQNRYIIDEAADIAWLGENASTLESGRTFIMSRDIDMNGQSGLSSINLPAGSTFEGDDHTIKGVKLSGALLGNATGLTVRNLNIEDVVITGASSHVGVLVNTLKGSSSFSNISISNSSASTASGAAGGMVGYIVRASEKDRTETLKVTFSGCVLNGVSIAGSASEGKFVGLLSGYDNNESISFDADCEAVDVQVADYVSVYTKANNSVWAGAIDATYDGWLGHETYRRGKVTFAGVRMAPRWDGTTVTAKNDLLLYNGESNKYEVHSPFDLAGVRNDTKSPAALYLMENVDMFGQGADGKFFVHDKFTQSNCASTDDNYFNPFSTIGFLEGNNLGIYNVALYSKSSTDRYAFILSGADGNVHQNIKLYNFCTVVPHIVSSNEDKSYGATFVLSAGGATYKMDNVHAYNCKVFALQKTGVLAGRVVSATMATISNCSVNDCYIENYDCKEHQEDFGYGVKFYTPGEIGGMFGFVENFATISNCHVKGTTIYAFGQNDQKAYGIITIPGRHVGTFIGDIRTSDNEKDKIVLTNCTVDSNTICTKRWDKHSKCNMIGKVYYVTLLDSKGTVTLDGKSII